MSVLDNILLETNNESSYLASIRNIKLRQIKLQAEENPVPKIKIKEK